MGELRTLRVLVPVSRLTLKQRQRIEQTIWARCILLDFIEVKPRGGKRVALTLTVETQPRGVPGGVRALRQAISRALD